MKFFDMHCHVGKWKNPDFCGRRSTTQDLVALYERLGAIGTLIMPTDLAQNRRLLEQLQQHRDCGLLLRFAYWVTPENIREVEDLANDVSALKIHPSFLKVRVTDPSLAPALELARVHQWPVIVHCGRWREVSGFEHVLEVAARYPEVNFVLSHMGGDSPCLVMGAVDATASSRLPNVFLGTESIREYWLIEYAVKTLGAERVVFGSDYNLNSPSAFLGVVRDANLDEEERQQVLYQNALRLLNITP